MGYFPGPKPLSKIVSQGAIWSFLLFANPCGTLQIVHVCRKLMDLLTACVHTSTLHSSKETTMSPEKAEKSGANC